MYALSFNMDISDLETNYGKPYHKAYYEIKVLLKKNGFEWIQGCTYLHRGNDLSAVVKVIIELKAIDWFRKSVRDIRGYKVEDWSDFTPLLKGTSSL